jgi:hypothetical protein
VGHRETILAANPFSTSEGWAAWSRISTHRIARRLGGRSTG